MAKWAAEQLIRVKPDERSSYSLRSNVYAASGHFEKAIEKRVSVKEKKIGKQPGCSSIEVEGEDFEFYSWWEEASSNTRKICFDEWILILDIAHYMCLFR